MAEHQYEQQRYEDGNLSHDFLSMSPEAIRLRQLIDMIGAYVVVSEVEVVEVET